MFQTNKTQQQNLKIDSISPFSCTEKREPPKEPCRTQPLSGLRTTENPQENPKMLQNIENQIFKIPQHVPLFHALKKGNPRENPAEPSH